jgi:hypothetical protein
MFTIDQFKFITHPFCYRVIIFTKDGKQHEPVKDAGTSYQSGLLGCLEIKFGSLLFVPICAILDSVDKEKTPLPQDLRNLEYILQWAAGRTKETVQSGQLVAAPIDSNQNVGKWRVYCTWTPERGVTACHNSDRAIRRVFYKQLPGGSQRW